MKHVTLIQNYKINKSIQNHKLTKIYTQVNKLLYKVI